MQPSTGTSTRCPHCGAGLYEQDGIAACDCGYAAMIPCNETNLLSAYERAGIPRRYWDAVWDDPRGSFRKSGRGLYVQGRGNGTGKTQVAMAVARKKLAAGWSVKCVSSVGILSMLRDSFGGSNSEEVFERLAAPDLLVIDDLGKENRSEWVISMLYRVIDERYGSMKPVIVTTNFSKRELIDRMAVDEDASIAKSIVSRLFEMTVKVEIEGEDRRACA